MYLDRIRHPGLHSRIQSAQQAAELIQDGMTVGISGFTRAGDCNAVPAALAQRAIHDPFRITLIKGASLGHDTDKHLAQANVLARRIPFQVDTTLRRKINAGEVDAGRLENSLLPLQAGIGTIANAVLHGFQDSDFENLTMYLEVLQDSAIELLDQGKLRFASASSITVSQPVYEKILANIDHYRNRIVLRTQEISSAPELVRRLGLIAINTALECDIYGNVNSTHVGGTHMMNGMGGSGDFARNAHLAIFVTKSIAKDGDISSIVPMVPHVDHAEHDVDIIVTECGLADLRGLAPRERALAIIKHCAHPDYKKSLQDYFTRACWRGGQTPHLLEKAFSWHQRYKQTQTMRP